MPPAFVAAMAALVLYAAALRRYNRRHPSRPFPPRRAAAFALGVLAAAAALGPPLDPLSAWLLSAHMVQHLLLMFVAAPLLVIGTPLRLARQSGVRTLERIAAWCAHSPLARAATWPPAAWGFYAATLVGSHFSPLYEAALEHPAVHVVEHALYLTAALLFWYPVVGLDPSPWRMGYGLRLLYLAAAIPVQSLLGVAFSSAVRPLYPHYAIAAAVRGTSVLTDQQIGGAIMWVGGALPMVSALVCVALAWAAEERRLADYADRAGPGGGTVSFGADLSSRMNPRIAPSTPAAPTATSHQP
jgi:cytochrome c oxidase assembly factor CtaG